MEFLHIEIISQEFGGNLLVGSVWGRKSPGVAVSLLEIKHVKHSCYAYQLTLAWLHALKLQVYKDYFQVGCHEKQ